MSITPAEALTILALLCIGLWAARKRTKHNHRIGLRAPYVDSRSSIVMHNKIVGK